MADNYIEIYVDENSGKNRRKYRIIRTGKEHKFLLKIPGRTLKE